MASIFISYRRKPGSQATAGRLHDRLAPKFGAENVFFDVDMDPGVDFVAVIEEKVSACDVLIAVIAADWQPERLAHPRDFVRLEIAAALDRNIRVIPVLVDGTPFPGEQDLPEPLLPLLRRNALELRHGSFHQDAEKLIRAIEKVKAPAKTLDTRSPYVNPVDGLTYVWIPPGKFMMGASPGDGESFDDEKPVHEVEITRGFWLSQTPVTQAAWRKVMGTAPSRFKGKQLPVESVTWDEAREYCSKVGGRLPTEAEWEYAARVGTTSSRYGELDSIAWYYGNSGGKTHPVAAKQANAFQLFDMLGNLWEWCEDRYGPYDASPVRDPKGPAAGDTRILRGGSWVSFPRDVRVSSRAWYVPTNRDDDTGVRCAGEFR